MIERRKEKERDPEKKTPGKEGLQRKKEDKKGSVLRRREREREREKERERVRAVKRY